MKFLIYAIMPLIGFSAHASSAQITLADCRGDDSAIVLFKQESKIYGAAFKLEHNKYTQLKIYQIGNFSDSTQELYFSGFGINGRISKIESYDGGFDKDGQIASDTIGNGQVLNYKCDLSPFDWH